MCIILGGVGVGGRGDGAGRWVEAVGVGGGVRNPSGAERGGAAEWGTLAEGSGAARGEGRLAAVGSREGCERRGSGLGRSGTRDSEV